MKIIRENLIAFEFTYIVNPYQTLSFVINWKAFNKSHLASHFGLYLRKESKFS